MIEDAIYDCYGGESEMRVEDVKKAMMDMLDAQETEVEEALIRMEKEGRAEGWMDGDVMMMKVL